MKPWDRLPGGLVVALVAGCGAGAVTPGDGAVADSAIADGAIADAEPGDGGADAGATGPFQVVVDRPLDLGGTPLALSRLDAAVGGDGRVYFTGYGGGAIHVCSFNGEFVGHRAGRGPTDLDLSCTEFAAGPLYFYPRIALDDADRPAVVWDLASNLETRGRYLDQEQALFTADITSVNHPDIAWFDGQFTAVSQWYYAIGRVRFASLPASLDPVADWDAGEGGSEKKAPSLTANRDGAAERMAWACYWGPTVFLKSQLAGGAIVDREYHATAHAGSGGDLQGYPGWPHVAVDRTLDIHLAWHDWVDTGDGVGEYRGVEYRHIAHPGLTLTENLYLDLPLGDLGGQSPAVAVDDAGDVAIAFASNLAAGSSVYVLLRDAGADDFAGAPLVLESGKSGSYQPAAVGYGGEFWLLYPGKDGDQVHAVRLARGP